MNIKFNDLTSIYSGDKSDYRDIECTSERPSHYHDPVVTNGVHTGWTLRRVDAENALYKKYNAIQNDLIKSLTVEYPEEITKTFDKQDREARAFTADSNAVTPLLDSIAANRGLTRAEMAVKIISKSDPYTAAIGQVTGSYDKLKENISTLTETEILDLLK